jgi:hypothetical protein
MIDKKHRKLWTKHNVGVHWAGFSIIPQLIRATPFLQPLVPKPTKHYDSQDIRIPICFSIGLLNSMGWFVYQCDPENSRHWFQEPGLLHYYAHWVPRQSTSFQSWPPPPCLNHTNLEPEQGLGYHVVQNPILHMITLVGRAITGITRTSKTKTWKLTILDESRIPWGYWSNLVVWHATENCLCLLRLRPHHIIIFYFLNILVRFCTHILWPEMSLVTSGFEELYNLSSILQLCTIWLKLLGSNFPL